MSPTKIHAITTDGFHSESIEWNVSSETDSIYYVQVNRVGSDGGIVFNSEFPKSHVHSEGGVLRFGGVAQVNGKFFRLRPEKG